MLELSQVEFGVHLINQSFWYLFDLGILLEFLGSIWALELEFWNQIDLGFHQRLGIRDQWFKQCLGISFFVVLLALELDFCGSNYWNQFWNLLCLELEISGSNRAMELRLSGSNKFQNQGFRIGQLWNLVLVVPLELRNQRVVVPVEPQNQLDLELIFCGSINSTCFRISFLWFQ